MPDYVISSDELNKLRNDASVSDAIKELANILSGRSQDLPHRFRAPAIMAEYMSDWGNNSTYQYHQLSGNNPANPLILQFTTRPTQRILEIVFQGSDGMRLFTLEIEYAVQKEGQ